MYMFNRIHSYNNYLIHVIYFVSCSAVEPMTTLSWQLCKQACYQVGYGWTHDNSVLATLQTGLLSSRLWSNALRLKVAQQSQEIPKLEKELKEPKEKLKSLGWTVLYIVRHFHLFVKLNKN